MKKNIYITNPLPEGKNGLTSRANYVQRKKYNFVFKNLINTSFVENNFIDLQNLYKNFCKIDENEEPINISESVLKNLNEDIYAVNFVVDAFNELKILCENNDKIKNEKFKKLKAKKAWVSLHKSYHEHINIIFDGFLKHINNTHKDKKIDNFEKFIFEYVKFLDNVIYKTPFLKSSYLLSTQYADNNTGFIIEIDNIGSDDDYKKIKDFMLDYEYNEFLKLCKKTNFLIDKDCPWRLVYNTFSEKSEDYMKKYNVNKNMLINDYFYHTKESDLENLKNYMIIMYNTFVKEKPIAHNVKIITQNERQILSRNFIDRKEVSIEQIDSKFNINFWFNIYTHLSFVENKINLTHEQYKMTLKDLDKTLSLNGQNIAMQELKKIIQNNTKTQTKGEYNFSLPPSS